MNGQFSAELARDARLTLDIFNIPGANADDTTYHCNSWTKQDSANPVLLSDPVVNPALGGADVPDFHSHPTPKRTFRFSTSAPL